ncbi:hypothetical protein OJ997_03710 [Solirubrobacter phytolaccae]|uniref:Uncharacterized protein n=1 Tax=Solirubrobacter phytolaccae TaxID=1404360 RepID=A0A9X3S7P0_9ACTN|nr:hypothetical protein [Solirubrobacter phytolaccae]MDA0179391.1 hypothetical protein [Solirubrobacter phytolaccae]
MTNESFVEQLRAAVPEAFTGCAPDEFDDEDGALTYPALAHALFWLDDHAVKFSWLRRRRGSVRPEFEDVMRRFWTYLERVLEDPGELDAETLIWIECFEHDDWTVAERFMGPRTLALRSGLS